MPLTPLRITFNQACQLLNINRDALYRLIKTDSAFPKIIKDGNTKQAACYFDYADIMNWWERKKMAA